MSKMTSEKTGKAMRALVAAVRQQVSEAEIKALVVKLTVASFSDGWDSARDEMDASGWLEKGVAAVLEELAAAGALTLDETILADATARLTARFEAMAHAPSNDNGSAK